MGSFARPPRERYVRCSVEHGGPAMERAVFIGDAIAHGWPDRAYFVEVWQDGRRGFAQVFQPFGVPRNRPRNRT